MNFYPKLAFLLLFVFPFFSQSANGQTKLLCEVIHIDTIYKKQLPSFEKIVASKDSLEFASLIQADIIQLWSEGYLLAHLDSIFLADRILIANVFVGSRYTFGEVSVSEENLSIVSAAGLKNVRWNDKLVSLEMVGQYAETVLTYLENNGYPFARIHLDSTSIVNGIVNTYMYMSKNRYVPFDTLNLIGKVDIRQGYMERYLNIKATDPYSRKKVKDIAKRINNLTFVELDTTPLIKFANGVAQVQLYLKSKRASRFDFLIGVLPSADNGTRKFSIIGEFTGEMYNKLGQGEYIFANVQTRPETRVLEVRFNYPYLFDLPLGIDFKGGIFFNEVFRETIWDGGILYQFDGGASIKASWNNKSSRLIDIDTAAILTTGRLPNQLDITYNGGGLEYNYQNVDYRFNPSKGWELNLAGTVGIKKIIKNNRIQELSRTDLDFNLAYDSLKLNTLQTEATLSAAVYIPAFRIATFKLGFEGGIQYNEEKIFENELYRIGGNSLLRGFDELSVLTSSYLISTVEFRLLLDRNSYLSFPFIDVGLTKVSIDEEEVWDNTISLGMGINFSTPAGIFNVSFAAGRRLNNPIDLGNTKIHFGYVSLF
ncbi:MAG: BamA/TamA family outer membrane protein [Saprospiraceae bacterium]|nr:BamA/TamA family outer membrane protein [Saprospiraceae bacterium]